MSQNISKRAKLIKKLNEGLSQFARLKNNNHPHLSLIKCKLLYEGRTLAGHHVSVSVYEDDMITYSWIDRAGLKEGWELEDYPITPQGVNKVLARVKNTLNW